MVEMVMIILVIVGFVLIWAGGVYILVGLMQGSLLGRLRYRRSDLLKAYIDHQKHKHQHTYLFSKAEWGPADVERAVAQFNHDSDAVADAVKHMRVVRDMEAVSKTDSTILQARIKELEREVGGFD